MKDIILGWVTFLTPMVILGVISVSIGVPQIMIVAPFLSFFLLDLFFNDPFH